MGSIPLYRVQSLETDTGNGYDDRYDDRDVYGSEVKEQ